MASTHIDAHTEDAPLLHAAEDTASVDAKKHSSHLNLTIAALATGTLLGALDLTIVAAIWPTIGAEFKALNQTAYVAVAYHLSNTAFQPLYGRLSDIFGRRNCLLFANTVFCLGTLGCCIAPNLWTLVFARFVAGAGGGGLNVVSVIILSDLVSVRQRGIYQGVMNIVFGAGAALGAPLGGIIADHLGWRWAFGIQVPIILLSITMVARFIKVTKTSQNNEEDWKARVRRIDFLGSSMLVSAVSCLIIGLNTGGNLLPWSSPVPLSLIAGTVVLGTCFVLVEIKVASDPILAVRLMRARTPVLTAAANLLTTAAYFIIIFQLPLFYKAVLHLSAGETGRRLIPGAIGGSLGSVSIGLLMSFYGTYYRFMLMCSALLVVGTIFVRSLGLESSLFAQFTVLIPCGIGYGGLLTTTLIALLKAVRKDEMASATGMSYLARATGSILGISVSSNVLNTLLGARLVPVLGKKMTERVKRDAELIWALDKHKRIAVLGIYVDCMHLLFAGAIILSVLGGLCAAAVERKSLKEEDAVVQSST